jgi:hypothetical protein
MGVILYDESAFRKISTSLLYYARANPEFRKRLRRAFEGDSSGSNGSGSGGSDGPASLPSQCEVFAAMLYHSNRRAAKERAPSEDHPQYASIPDAVEPGAFAPDDLRPEEIDLRDERPDELAHPAHLQKLVEEVAYNSDLPKGRTRNVEAAVAHLVLDE